MGKILSAEKIEESEKLLKLEVNFGSEDKRRVISGIAKSFPDPEVLAGKQFVFVMNLEPRTIMGYESQAMIMAADSPDGPVLLAPEKEVPAGSLIK